MFKVAWIARFVAGKDPAEVRGYWAEQHGPLCITMPALDSYVQNHVLGPLPSVSGVSEEETMFDGYSCAWWSDEEAYETSMASPEWDELARDGDNIFDMQWLWGMSAQVQEYPIIEGPSSPYKVVWIVRFKEGLERAQADEYWANTHGPIFKGLDIDRYVQNHVVKPLAPDVELGFDGFSECWFRDEDAFLRSINSDAWAEAVEDVVNIFDGSMLWGARLQERVVKAGKELAAA